MHCGVPEENSSFCMPMRGPAKRLSRPLATLKKECIHHESRYIHKKRIFLIVLDSVGIGAEPDAADYGDEGTNTLKSAASSPYFHMPNMESLGLFNIDGIDWHSVSPCPPAQRSHVCAKLPKGKTPPSATGRFPASIPAAPCLPIRTDFRRTVLDEFTRRTGRGVLCNRPYSGTEVIKGLRRRARKDRKAHSSTPRRTACSRSLPMKGSSRRKPCTNTVGSPGRFSPGEHGVGRVIARPFEGESGHYVRTPRRHDFSIEPPSVNMLDQLKEKGYDCIAVGKIFDIFAGKGITEHVYTAGNAEGMQRTLEYQSRDFEGLCSSIWWTMTCFTDTETILTAMRRP